MGDAYWCWGTDTHDNHDGDGSPFLSCLLPEDTASLSPTADSPIYTHAMDDGFRSFTTL